MSALPASMDSQKCLNFVARKKKFIFAFAIFGIIYLYLLGFTPFLLVRQHAIPMESSYPVTHSPTLYTPRVVLVTFHLLIWKYSLLYLILLQNPGEIVAMRSVLIKPIRPDSEGRCRQWDNTHLLCLPNVFLLGASKCGTSSWFNYLVQHPRVASVRRRVNGAHPSSNEVHRFDSPWFHFYPMKVSICYFME